MIYLCGIFLNESEFMENWLTQHYDWADKIVLIHGADVHYPRDRVTSEGFSLDDSEEIARSFPDPERKITVVRHGWAGDTSQPGSGKCVLRNEYAKRCTQDGYLIACDLDEFYTQEDQAEISRRLPLLDTYAVQFPTVHFWKNTSQVITGGYYDMGHWRFWKWSPGCNYRPGELAAHNFPRDPQRKFLQRKGRRNFRRQLIKGEGGYSHEGPCCYHFGFARNPKLIQAKNDYYLNRGEGKDRPETTRNRAAYFDQGTPAGCEVLPWAGALPEAFTRDRVESR